jgi:hypothetical protein
MRGGMPKQKFNRCNTKAFRENPLICAVQIIYMKPGRPVLFCIFLMLLGCSKDQNQTTPSIKLKSYTDHVNSNGSFNAVLTYSQKSGNLSGDSLTIIRHRYNQTPIPIGVQTPDTLLTLLPQTPNTSNAEFSVSLAWANISYGINGENDTFDFRFVLVDINGNHSDTVTTGKVVVLQ